MFLRRANKPERTGRTSGEVARRDVSKYRSPMVLRIAEKNYRDADTFSAL